MGGSMDFTVAVCTFNRAAALDRTLRAMSGLRLPSGLEWEIVVVNNNCTDSTDEVIARHTSRLPIRRLFEATQGCSAARNCAIRSAKGRYVIFTDDDCLVVPEWLAVYHEAIVRWPEIVVFGGAVEPEFESQAPRWIKDNVDLLSQILVIVQHGGEERLLGPTESPITANVGIRGDVLKQYMFDERLGHVGDERRGGEDIDLYVRIGRDGHRALWLPKARVKHLVAPDRLNIRFIWQSYMGGGRMAIRMETQRSVRQLFGFPRWLLRQYLQALVVMWLLFPVKSRAWVNAFRTAASCRGMLAEINEQRRDGR
jgi:glycosyltransferase involved in cell wall biosynthesis